MYIGIDLGTSNSTIAGIEDGIARVFRPADGGEALPSVIYIDKRGHHLYGRRAYDKALISPENVAAGFKRLMGTATPIEIEGADVTLTPEECSAEIIRQLLGQASTETGLDSFEGAVIAIPASFDQMQAEATLRAARMAGLEQVDLIQEPIAAALASMAGAKRSGKFLIYDLGGGTFDLALVESTDGKVRILAQQGVNMLGGRDFDRLIVSEIVRPWLMANFDLPDMFLRDPIYRRLHRIALLAAEKAKIDLSALEEAAIFASDDEVRLMDQSETEIFLDAPITRAQLEELIRKPIEQTVALVRTILEENDLTPEDIDRVVFVGGPSRIPLVHRLVAESLGIEADLKTDPMTAVAEGATYYVENRNWGENQTEEKKKKQKSLPESLPAESAPKKNEGPAQTEGEPNLYFDFDLRTPNDETAICIHVEGPSDGRKIQLHAQDWDSEILALKDELEITVPLSNVSENLFDVRVLDASGSAIEEHAQTLTITRLVAEPIAVPAAHSIAVKVLQSPEAEENSFLFLVEKGEDLPASGEINLKSGADLESGNSGFIGFEVFQVEFPDRIEVNLCVGLFRIDGTDLPEGHAIAMGDPIIFSWRMNESGILQASVKLPASDLTLKAPRFYAPQAGQISYGGTSGEGFTKAILERADEAWGDLAAAVGPMAGPEFGILKTRLNEQFEILEESAGDAEMMRRISEDARFIRQDVVKLGQKYTPALLQRQLGKLQAVFNRVCRGKAKENENEAFDALAANIQKIIDGGEEKTFSEATFSLAKMRHLFLSVAWQNPAYVQAWFNRLSQESWLFADQKAFNAMVEKGKKQSEDPEALRTIVLRLLDARVALSASDDVNDLATIIKE